jgi:hypothetical protein
LTIVDFQIQFEAIEAHIQAFYQAFIQLWGFVTTMNTELNGVTAAVSALSEQVTQNTLAIAELQQQQSSQSCFPIASAAGLDIADLETSNLAAFTIPAACFTDGAWVKVRIAYTPWDADTEVSPLNLVNLSTDTPVSLLSAPNGSPYRVEAEVIIRKNVGSNDFNIRATTTAYLFDSTSEVYNLATYNFNDNPYAETVINVNEDQQFAIQEFSPLGLGRILSCEIIGYKSI